MFYSDRNGIGILKIGLCYVVDIIQKWRQNNGAEALRSRPDHPALFMARPRISNLPRIARLYSGGESFVP